MATVQLTQLWVHDADDLADHVRIDVETVQVDPALDVQYHRRADGTVTSSQVPVRTRTMQAAGWVDVDVWRWLDSRVGQRVFVRAPDGEAWWGVYDQLPAVSRYGGRQVAFTVTQVRDVA